jgi:hypothetical protein
MTGTAAEVDGTTVEDERTLSALRSLAEARAVHIDDVLLVALNLWGVSSHASDGRVRAEVRLGDGPEWHVIVPSGRDSPLTIDDQRLILGGEPVGSVRLVEHDDAHLGYIRGKGLTLNTNRRSTCVGCVFCPNTLADSADPRSASSPKDIAAYLRFLCTREGWKDLSGVEQVNLSTGCFGTADRAIAHLAMVRQVLADLGFAGRLGILSSVIRTLTDFERMRQAAGPCALILTLECVERREVILKDTKADLTPDAAVEVLKSARSAGVDTGVTMIVGLDPIDTTADWLARAAPHLTDFPNLQIYQAHSPLMEIFRQPGSDTVAFMLAARRRLESVGIEARPVWWQNFRPLWYRHYAAERLR